MGVFVFPLELLAALLAFPAPETVGDTTLSIIAFSWLGTAFVTHALATDPASPTLGVLYLSIALILLLLGGVGVLGKPLLATTMFLVFFRYVLNGLFELTEISSLQPVSGVFGCLIFALSLYGGLALSLEDVQHRTVLPSCRHDEQVAPSQRRPASQSNFRGFGFLYRKERRADVLPASPEARMFSMGRGKREERAN